MAKETLNELANNYVIGLEEDYIADLAEKVPDLSEDTYLQDKVKGALNDELYRIYGNDDDHEEDWIARDDYNKWIKGESRWWEG